MKELDNWFECGECDNEFQVIALATYGEHVEYCPFCASELKHETEEEDDADPDEEEDD